MQLALHQTICGSTIDNRPDQSLLIGLSLTIPRPNLTPKQVVDYIQGHYFDNDNISPSGFFRLMAQAHSEQLGSLDYLHAQGTYHDTALSFDACIRHVSSDTVADVLFAQLSFESTHEEELNCTLKELQAALEEGVFTSILQFPLRTL